MNRVVAGVMLAVLVVIGWITPALAGIVTSARTGSDVTIGSGNVVVNRAISGPTLGNGFSLYIDRRSTIHDSIQADRIRIFNQAVISGSATFNQLTNDGVISGGQFSPLTLLVFSAVPTFQEAVFGGNPANVSVAATITRVLTPGEYGDITGADTGKIIFIFTDGVYHIRSIDATGDGVILAFNAASEVRISGKCRTRRSAVIGPASDSRLSAANIVFYIGGVNGTSGSLDATPEAARVGSGSVVTANFYVPNGTARVETDVFASGALIAGDVQIDSRASLLASSAFVNRAPTANPQDVATNGAEPLLITLTALDPENGPMTFAIQGAGLQFPSRGSLGPVIPASTTAPVTYTPSSAANEENSFTFSATDACGNIGMATVRINSVGDTTNPPIAQVVDATDVVVETPPGTPRDVTLMAGAPPAATLTFSVESLPAHGNLKDASGAPADQMQGATMLLPAFAIDFDKPNGVTATVLGPGTLPLRGTIVNGVGIPNSGQAFVDTISPRDRVLQDINSARGDGRQADDRRCVPAAAARSHNVVWDGYCFEDAGQNFGQAQMMVHSESALVTSGSTDKYVADPKTTNVSHYTIYVGWTATDNAKPVAGFAGWNAITGRLLLEANARRHSTGSYGSTHQLGYNTKTRNHIPHENHARVVTS